MSDIAERLRNSLLQGDDPALYALRNADIAEAAGEIERLANENAMLRADNAALRAALQGYMDWHRLETGDGGEVPLTEPAKSP